MTLLKADLREKLYRIAKDVAADRRQKAVRELCDMAGMTALEVGPRREVKLSPLPPKGSGVTQATGPQTEEMRPERVEDEALLASFRKANPVCCVKGCGRKSVAHHINKRSPIRIDSHWNLLHVCDGADGGHHRNETDSIHALGPEGFVAEHGDNLELRVIKKIMAAVAFGKTLKKKPARVRVRSSTPDTAESA